MVMRSALVSRQRYRSQSFKVEPSFDVNAVLLLVDIAVGASAVIIKSISNHARSFQRIGMAWLIRRESRH
jgi:hypothetical protein